MALLSFAAMFCLMYAMVDRADNALANVNQVYMAALMALPMVVIEIFVMKAMYPDRRRNIAIVAACLAGTVVFWLAIRAQWAVTDGQFLRSMIPHHACAILMCERADVADAAVLALCREIVASQNAEIAQMKDMLADR